MIEMMYLPHSRSDHHPYSVSTGSSTSVVLLQINNSEKTVTSNFQEDFFSASYRLLFLMIKL